MSLKNPTFFAGMYRAAAFAYGVGGSGVEGLQVDSPSGAVASASTETLTLAFGSITLNDGTIVSPLATTAKVTVGTGSSADTVTPSSVSNNTPQVYQSTTFTAATYANSHGTGDLVSSASIGLQEALNFASGAGGGIVVVDAAWYSLGGTTAMIDAATVAASCSIWDTTQGGVQEEITVNIPNASVLTLESVGYQLIPAPGAGNLVVVDRIVVEQVAKTGAFSGSPGVLTAAYGTQASQIACTGSIAATVLTGGSGTTNQIGMALGVAPANGNSSAWVNSKVGLYVATNDPTTGAGSLIVKVTYRILTGF